MSVSVATVQSNDLDHFSQSKASFASIKKFKHEADSHYVAIDRSLNKPKSFELAIKGQQKHKKGVQGDDGKCLKEYDVYNQTFPSNSKFPDDCDFSSGCIFGDNVKFGKRSRFGKYCRFGKGCAFDDACYFDINAQFGIGCVFGKCVFENGCQFGISPNYDY
eukprot:CAMPEP_0197078864 /NCGR_PEP_ID=MMETSP1384-20130603/213338_1 /TAXON_ID=29189 /ORGANISM="Ammonia sp." /LENGTH=161 /DNA_ID=CAMNT_0042517733 /DNA_START=28 /DNA_END=513 /DNA_ORIENTATION=+